jgi:heat shock protein HslJ
MQAEHAYFQSLGKVAGYKLDGDTLTLSDADGKDLLRFSR